VHLLLCTVHLTLGLLVQSSPFLLQQFFLGLLVLLATKNGSPHVLQTLSESPVRRRSSLGSFQFRRRARIQSLGSSLHELFAPFASVAIPGLLQFVVSKVLDGLGRVRGVFLQRLGLLSSRVLLHHLMAPKLFFDCFFGALEIGCRRIVSCRCWSLVNRIVGGRMGKGQTDFLEQLFSTLSSVAVAGFVQSFINGLLGMLPSGGQLIRQGMGLFGVAGGSSLFLLLRRSARAREGVLDGIQHGFWSIGQGQRRM